jgi:phosphopantothenoylcysteine decarboxylase
MASSTHRIATVNSKERSDPNMAQLILGVTGSVAAIRTPALFANLSAAGHTVRVLATEPALYFFDPHELAQREGDLANKSAMGPVFRDIDEWPGPVYSRGDAVLHIEFRNWADILIVAPLDANTLAKFALGLSDNFLTCLFRAWDFSKPVILAPAMNTLMWESPVTLRHLRQLLEDRGTGPIPQNWSLNEAAVVFASHAPRIVLVPPQAKRLACGDVGIGAMAEVAQIAEVVRLSTEQTD